MEECVGLIFSVKIGNGSKIGSRQASAMAKVGFVPELPVSRQSEVGLFKCATKQHPDPSSAPCTSSLADSPCMAEGGHLRKAANAANARAVFVATIGVGRQL